MHGWCAEKENRGKGGSGKGKIGVGVGSCPKIAFLQCFCAFLGDSAASRQVQTWCQKFENWCPTGSRLDPDWPKAVPKNAKIGARLGPDWVPTGSRLGFFKKTPISLNLSTYF